MTPTIEWRKEWPSFALLLIAVAATLWAYPHLPDPMPTHWNAQNEVDGYSSRAVGAWLMPLLIVGLYLLLLVLPRLDPRRENVARMGDLYRLFRVGLSAVFTLIHIVMLAAIVSGRADWVGLAVPALVGILFILVGNYMPRMRPNWFMGIRTPWTLSSDTVWRKTHLLGGRLFMLAGLAMLVAPLLPAALQPALLIGTIVLAALIPIAYSYWLFRQQSEQPTA